MIGPAPGWGSKKIWLRFPARSYIREGDWRPRDGVWHWTDDHRYLWKADTSSDEIVGHFYAYGLAYDLLLDNELKQRLRGAVARIMDHILEHGYNLIDVTGQPMTWGKWSREYFATRGGGPDSPLNALELLSFLRTAEHITGDPKYEREWRKAFDEGETWPARRAYCVLSTTTSCAISVN